MTPEQEQAVRLNLLNKSVKELIDIIVSSYDELEEARSLRKRMVQIRNLVLEPEERRKPGRPSKEEALFTRQFAKLLTKQSPETK